MIVWGQTESYKNCFVLCCVRQLCTVVRTHEQLLQMSVDLSLCIVFGHLLRLAFCTFFWFILDYFVIVLFAFVVLSLVSSVLRQAIGWEERIRNYLFSVEWYVNP